MPFLIVFPASVIDIETQFDLLEIRKGRRGSLMYREPTRWITDLVLTPAKPYLIFDVDLGVNSAETYGVRHLAETQKLLDEKGRRGLTVAETIALASHFPDIVQRNTIYATASSWQFADSEGIPRLSSVFGYPLLSNVVAEYFRVQGWVLPASCQQSAQKQVSR